MAGGIIEIFGAAGTGKTTLARTLGEACGLPVYDTDDFYWIKTDPPFQHRRGFEEIEALIAAEVTKTPRCVISGGLSRYSSLVRQLRAVVFLSMEQEARIARILARERARYGDRMNPGGDMHATHLEFMRWCGSYETSRTEPGNRFAQEQWLKTLICPLLRLDATQHTDVQVARVAGWLRDTSA